MTYYRLHQNSEPVIQKKGKIAISLAIIFVLLALSVFYLIQINQLVAKNFELHNFQKAFNQSQDNAQGLFISLMQMRSLSKLEQAAKDLNLVIIEKANYLKIVPGFFALSE